MKEGSYLQRGSSLSEGSGLDDDDGAGGSNEGKQPAVSPPAAREGVPIRQ